MDLGFFMMFPFRHIRSAVEFARAEQQAACFLLFNRSKNLKSEEWYVCCTEFFALTDLKALKK